MRNLLQFPKSQDGRDGLLATFWIVAALGISVAANWLAIVCFSAGASLSFFGE